MRHPPQHGAGELCTKNSKPFIPNRHFLFTSGDGASLTNAARLRASLFYQLAERQVAPSSLLSLIQLYRSNSTTAGGSGHSKAPSTGGGGGSGGNGKTTRGSGDKGWTCPNCGELCTHIDMFVCKLL